MDTRQAKIRFDMHGYIGCATTSKVLGYKAPRTGRHIYLYLPKGAGPTSSLRVVIDPRIDVTPYLALADVDQPRDLLRHGGHMTAFPKHLHTGTTEIHFGSALKVHSLDGLDRVLRAYNE